MIYFPKSQVPNNQVHGPSGIMDPEDCNVYLLWATRTAGESLLGFPEMDLSLSPNNGDSNGKENGKLNGSWDCYGLYDLSQLPFESRI